MHILRSIISRIRQHYLKPIYTITTIKGLDPLDDTRTVGFYCDRNRAILAVHENWGDMYECGSYPYAVIETVYEGLYSTRGELLWYNWYKWMGDEHGGYVLIENPLPVYVGWGMG